MGTKAITAAQVNFLPGWSEIAVGQQQGGPKKSIAQECAVIAAADQVSGERKIDPVPGVVERETSGVGRAAKRTSPHKRSECTNGDSGKSPIKGAKGLEISKRAGGGVTGKRTFHHFIQIGVACASAQAVTESSINLSFSPKSASIGCVDVGSETGLRG